MKRNPLLSSLILASLATAASAASVVIDLDINDFDAASTSEFSSTNGTLTLISRSGTGTSYEITGVDLTTLGGTASETISFTIGFGGSSSAIGYKSWGDASVGGGNTDVGETFRADFGAISSTYGDVSFVGFTNAFVAALQASESASIGHDGGTISVAGPATNVPFAASSFFTISPTVGSMNIGGFDLQIVVVPEPSSLALLALGGIAFFRRRR